MDEQHSPALHGWNPGPGQGTYPGVGGGPGGFSGFGDPFGGGPSGFGGSFAGPPALVNPTVIPASGAGGAGGAGGVAASLPGKLADVKVFIDRMGGIDGVITGMTKFHKFVTTMQQFGPIIKLFMSKGKSKVSSVKSPSKQVRHRKSRPHVSPKVRSRSHGAASRRRR
ncbi:hypothetical protein SD71_01575 [Cohnella kolymensis]|uniref:Uncharacterized protein n=1 Tax=Cohnella kolymensis TaxID=1590652 RepID=A0ABR5A8T6_9BACL|nr:hypothetical protein [Cohnella kolymensis]KIL37385.1 hypothetical protein SD71_01575 [Cohnella kolymensis]